MSKLILGALVLAGALFVSRNKVAEVAKNMSKEPRGIRNNNPGNIRYSEHNKWRGQTGDDGAFAIFSEAKYGIRALAILLNNYSHKYGLNNVRDIINKYAPTNENNTGAYIEHVAKKLNVKADEYIDVKQRMPEIIEAIIKHENGKQPYSQAQILEGIEASGVKSYV